MQEMSNDIPSYSISTYGDKTFCKTIPGLTKSQLEVCYNQPDTTKIALQGLKHAVKECQHQFQSNRWNCSSLSTKAYNLYTSAIFKRGKILFIFLVY